MKFGLIGYPLEHSFSKSYFDKKFASLNIVATFENFEIPDVSIIKDTLKSYKNLSGLSVTIPYKEEIMNFLDDIDVVASEIGAVNCIKIEDNNKWIGYNTDWIGFTQSIKPSLRSQHTKGLILGTGGASKAVNYALKLLNIDSKTVSRTKRNHAISYHELTVELLSEYKIVVNCTPLGMFPDIHSFPDINYRSIGDEHLLFDLIYNPKWTMFLKKGKKQNAQVINGLDMLKFQAEAAWQIWTKNKS